MEQHKLGASKSYYSNDIHLRVQDSSITPKNAATQGPKSFGKTNSSEKYNLVVVDNPIGKFNNDGSGRPISTS